MQVADGLVIGECRYSVCRTDIDGFRYRVELLQSAVREGRMLDKALLEVWPKDEQKLELVMAAVNGWDSPRGYWTKYGDWVGDDEWTPREKAKELGMKVIGHNGAQWAYRDE